MTIRNSDGSKYKLRGPNPIASKQNSWESADDFIIHNMDWKSVNLPDLSQVKHFNSDFEIKDDTFSEPVAVVELPPAPEEVKEEPKVVEKLEKPRSKSKTLKNAVDIWCLPAQLRHYPDEPDPHKRLTIEYFDKVMIEGVIVHHDTFYLTFWTNVDVSQKGSIIYPFRNSEGRPLDFYSWWKVDEIIGADEDDRLKESGGWLFVCVPSEYTPHFDD